MSKNTFQVELIVKVGGTDKKAYISLDDLVEWLQKSAEKSTGEQSAVFQSLTGHFQTLRKNTINNANQD